MAKQFDIRKQQRDREDRDRAMGLQRLICNSPGRFHVSPGNVVRNGLTFRWGSRGLR